MAFTIPNDVAGGTAEQHILSSPDTGDIAILASAFAGTGVFSGCAVTSNNTLTLSVAAGVIKSAGVGAAVTAGSVVLATADPTNPRIDLVVASSAGALSAVTGTPAATSTGPGPVYPAIPAGSVVLAIAYVANTATVVASTDLVDKRVFISVTKRLPSSYSVSGTISVPSGATNYLPPFIVPLPPGQSATLHSVTFVIRSGTSVTFNVTQNGTSIDTGLSATTTLTESAVLGTVLANHDQLEIVVTAVSGSPDGMTVTFNIDWTS